MREGQAEPHDGTRHRGLAASAVFAFRLGDRDGKPRPDDDEHTALGAAFGFRRTLSCLAGVVLGTVAVLIAVATGAFAILFSIMGVEPVFIAASATYLLYLAWRIATAPPLSQLDDTATAPSFFGGFLLATANPKAYVAIAAVFAGSIVVPADPLADALAKTAVLAAMIVAIHLCWLLAGASLSRFLHDPLYSRIANTIFASALVASVVVPWFW